MNCRFSDTIETAISPQAGNKEQWKLENARRQYFDKDIKPAAQKGASDGGEPLKSHATEAKSRKKIN